MQTESEGVNMEGNTEALQAAQPLLESGEQLQWADWGTRVGLFDQLIKKNLLPACLIFFVAFAFRKWQQYQAAQLQTPGQFAGPQLPPVHSVGRLPDFLFFGIFCVVVGLTYMTIRFLAQKTRYLYAITDRRILVGDEVVKGMQWSVKLFRPSEH